MGIVHKYGDNIDTDVIIPARYLNSPAPEDLAQHCMEDCDKEFVNRVKPGDFIVAGENFGCGSSREHAPISIKASGIQAVVAKSFARIFYRNSINTGLAIMECPDTDEISAGDELEVNLEAGEIRDLTTGKVYKSAPFPAEIMEIIKAGGLLSSIAKRSGK